MSTRKNLTLDAIVAMAKEGMNGFVANETKNGKLNQLTTFAVQNFHAYQITNKEKPPSWALLMQGGEARNKWATNVKVSLLGPAPSRSGDLNQAAIDLHDIYRAKLNVLKDAISLAIIFGSLGITLHDYSEADGTYSFPASRLLPKEKGWSGALVLGVLIAKKAKVPLNGRAYKLTYEAGGNGEENKERTIHASVSYMLTLYGKKAAKKKTGAQENKTTGPATDSIVNNKVLKAGNLPTGRLILAVLASITYHDKNKPMSRADFDSKEWTAAMALAQRFNAMAKLATDQANAAQGNKPASTPVATPAAKEAA